MAPPLSLFLLANVDRREKKKPLKCESVQWHRVPGLTNGQCNLVSSSHPEQRHLPFMCFHHLQPEQQSVEHSNTTAALLVCSLCSKTGLLSSRSFHHIWHSLSIGLRAWSINDQISTESTRSRGKRGQVWWALEVALQRQRTSSPPSFRHVMRREWARAQTFCLHSKARLNAWPGGDGPLNLNKHRSLEPIRACAFTAAARLQPELKPNRFWLFNVWRGAGNTADSSQRLCESLKRSTKPVSFLQPETVLFTGINAARRC